MKFSICICIVAALTTTAVAETSTNVVETAPAAPVVAETSTNAVETAPAAPVVAETPTQAPAPVVVDEGRSWYGRPLRPAELLDRKVRYLRLTQTDAEKAADAAAEALAKAQTADIDRRNAVEIVRPYWFDTSADAQRGEALLRVFEAARRADEAAKAAATAQAAADDLEAASRRLLGRVSHEVGVVATSVRGSVGAAANVSASAATIAANAKAEEARR